jgi:hemerythrin superfamily protein
MTIFQILKADHKKVSALLKKLEKTTEKQPALREKLFNQFRIEFLTHATAEDAAVYTPLKAKEATREMILEAREEHSLVEHLILLQASVYPSDERWGPKMTVIQDLIEHHVEEEESELFKKMRKHCTPEELENIARKMNQAKKRVTFTRAPGRVPQWKVAA